MNGKRIKHMYTLIMTPSHILVTCNTCTIPVQTQHTYYHHHHKVFLYLGEGLFCTRITVSVAPAAATAVAVAAVVGAVQAAEQMFHGGGG